MRAIWTALPVIVTLVLALFLATFYDMAKQQVQKWLFGIPFGVMKWAALRVPAHLQATARNQWRAALTEILENQRYGPISKLVRSLLYSSQLLVFTSSAIRQLTIPVVPVSHRRPGLRAAKGPGVGRIRPSTALTIAMITLLAGASATYLVLPSVGTQASKDSIGTQAPTNAPINPLSIKVITDALTRVGDPYVWGAAGPKAFDSSGLVLWAYSQIGVDLIHYSGDQWTEGAHIPRNKLQPGDLVFFFPDISHVAMYIGYGLMVNAPAFGQTVSVQPIPWKYYIGAVQIIAPSSQERDLNAANYPERRMPHSRGSEPYADEPRSVIAI